MRSDDRREIYRAFCDGSVEVKSVSKDRRVEWKRVCDVTRHDVGGKAQFRVAVDSGSHCTATADHSLFSFNADEILECATSHFVVGSPIVCVDGESVVKRIVTSNLTIPPERYMFDLSVGDNQNFVLDSGILAHNSFRPPSSEKFIQAQTKVFGYIWEDEELYEYLINAADLFNSFPPVTGITLDNMPDRWRTTILLRAGAFACAAVALNWIADEYGYSISGVSLDLEKSSKYESMKNNFLTEFKEAAQQAKDSIKIVVGLQQPRYGIGISSALGPFSAPGVQSRRNYISG